MQDELAELIAQAKSSDWQQRHTAVFALGAHSDSPEAVEQLETMLSDSDIAVQVSAAEVLILLGGDGGTTRVLEELGRRRDDPDADHVAYKLQELQGLSEVPILQTARRLAAESDSALVRLGLAEIEALFGHYAPE